MDTTPHKQDDSVCAANPSNNDPTANLTFDLRLSEAEKEARSKVVLPYMSQQHRQEEEEGDEDDELDFDSDPDDDLDI